MCENVNKEDKTTYRWKKLLFPNNFKLNTVKRINLATLCKYTQINIYISQKHVYNKEDLYNLEFLKWINVFERGRERESVDIWIKLFCIIMKDSDEEANDSSTSRMCCTHTHEYKHTSNIFWRPAQRTHAGV